MPQCDEPAYDLAQIQACIRARHYVIRIAAFEGAMEVDMGEAEICECILNLTQRDFVKSMPAQEPRAAGRGLWQDVYKPLYLEEELYVKLQVQEFGKAVVISFKKRK